MVYHMLFAASKVCYTQDIYSALLTCADFRLMNQAAFGAIETWSRVEHPSIVRVREAFTTRAFNDNCTSDPHSTSLALTNVNQLWWSRMNTIRMLRLSLKCTSSRSRLYSSMADFQHSRQHYPRRLYGRT